jgi:Linalool dehydratase/isomerase
VTPALFDLTSIGAGPKTRWRLQRSLLIYSVVFVIGLVLAWGPSPAPLQSFGLGLIVPGGGFLLWVTGEGFHYVVHLTLFGAALAAFMASLVLWFATGNVLLPPIVWIGNAFAAAFMAHDTQWNGALLWVPLAAPALIALAFLANAFHIAQGKRIRVSRNEILRRAKPTFSPAKPQELKLEDVQLLRSLLDRALQPLSEFSGFEALDQYQTAALRYQLNFAGYALSAMQANHAPAFQGYLSQAQENLIRKQQDPRIWNYWARENAWGNLERNADPMARDNIMFTGFVGTQIAMFQGASGRSSFNATGSLSFARSDGKIFAHDFPGIVQNLERNFQCSALGLIACEPNWVYPLCNSIGAAAIKFHDSNTWSRRAVDFRQALDTEFLDAHGNMVPCRSLYTGLALPSLGGTVVQALPCFFLNATAPDLALRHWLVERDRMLSGGKLNMRRFWPVDVGNYKFSRASSFAATAAAAVELGDDEIARLLFDALDEHCPNLLKAGVRHRPKASLWAHGAELLARCGKAQGFADLVARKNSVPAIHIAGAPYPDVLVASAHAGQNWLEAVLYPGAKLKSSRLKIAGLLPSQTYRVHTPIETSLVADATGCGELDLMLEARTVFRLEKLM